MFGAAQKDPRQIAPVGAYLENGTVMLEVLGSDYSGVLGEDLVTGNLIEIHAGSELEHDWRPVRPQSKAA